jgi:uncharacterized protein YdaU (DUF1376 family)
MANFAYMPLYVADYLADTAHLSAAEHGVYLMLLMTYWQRQGGLPMDEAKLSRIARVSDKDWLRVRDNVMAFFRIQDGFLVQERMERELGFVREKTTKAKASASLRWSNSVANGMRTHSERTANEVPTQCSSVSVSVSEDINTKTVQEPASAAFAPPPKKARFSKPSLEEITAYCTERGNSVDPQHWLDHYTSNGWKVGRNPMTDWRATVRTWERNDVRRAGSGGVDARTVAEIFGGAS